MADATVLWALFASSFLATTRLPGGAAALPAYAASASGAGVAVLWAAATLGNTVGGLTGWVIGRWLGWRVSAPQAATAAAVLAALCLSPLEAGRDLA